MPRADMDFVLSLEIPLLHLDEQRRIVDILSRAEGIVRLRREAHRKAAELIPAIFIDMFGDPGTNPNGWSIVPMGELVGEFRYGTSQKSGPVGVPVLRIPNVVGGAMDLTEVKLVSLATAEHERLRLLNGDLLFVRTNGNPDFVGRCSVYDSKVLSVAGFDGSECVYASYLIRARLSDSRVSPAYLQAYLSSQRGRQLLRERAKTSAGQFNLNIDGLGSLPVPVPPQSLQRKFTESVDRFASVVSQQDSAQAAAGALFRSLLARAFGAGQ
jgi:type I restriction enzyme S subunit